MMPVLVFRADMPEWVFYTFVLTSLRSNGCLCAPHPIITFHPVEDGKVAHAAHHTDCPILIREAAQSTNERGNNMTELICRQPNIAHHHRMLVVNDEGGRVMWSAHYQSGNFPPSVPVEIREAIAHSVVLECLNGEPSKLSPPIREEIRCALAGVYSGAGILEVEALLDKLEDRGLCIVRNDDMEDRIAEDYGEVD